MFLEIAHVAHRLGFSQDYVRSLIHRKLLAAHRFPVLSRDGEIRPGLRWRVDEADLLVFINGLRVGVERRAVDAPADRRLRVQPRAEEAQG